MNSSALRHSREIILSLSLLILGAATARAHDPGLSAAEVRFRESSVEVSLSIAVSDVTSVGELNLEQQDLLSTSEMATATRLRLEDFAKNAIELWIAAQRLEPASIEIRKDAGGFDFQLFFHRTPGSKIEFRFPAIRTLARGHRRYVLLLDEQGHKLSEKMLDASVDKLELEINRRSSASTASSMRQFFYLGIEHILTGYDHLVFLLGLLIAGAGVKGVVRIITSFTVAHSITLAVSVFDLIRVPSGVVEPMIAFSIVYVGLENIFRGDMKWRWLVTFGFGLIHGFGFASALQDLGIGSGARAAPPLISFNIGVETGQLMIALVVLPLMLRLRKRPVFVTRIVPACSILVSVAGCSWLVDRMV